MKVIELKDASPSLDEAIGFAKDELVLLRRPDGSVYALSQVDDFDVEVEQLKHNPEFLTLMKRFSQQAGTISLQDLRDELGL